MSLEESSGAQDLETSILDKELSFYLSREPVRSGATRSPRWEKRLNVRRWLDPIGESQTPIDAT